MQARLFQRCTELFESFTLSPPQNMASMEKNVNRKIVTPDKRKAFCFLTFRLALQTGMQVVRLSFFER